MIIPIRCFTCGKVIAHLWEPYLEKLQLHYDKQLPELPVKTVGQALELDKQNDTIESIILDEMKLTRYCCRRMILSNLDLCDKV